MKARPLMYIHGPDVSSRPGPPRAKNTPARTTRASIRRSGWRWIIGHPSDGSVGLPDRAAGRVPPSWGTATRIGGTPCALPPGRPARVGTQPGGAGQLRGGVPVGGGQLDQDVRDVVAHRLRRQEQRGGDLTVAAPTGQQV